MAKIFPHTIISRCVNSLPQDTTDARILHDSQRDWQIEGGKPYPGLSNILTLPDHKVFEVQVSHHSENIHGEYYYLLVLALYSSLDIHHYPEQKKDAKLDGLLVWHDAPLVWRDAAILIFLTFTSKFLQERSSQIEYLGGNDIGTSTVEHLMATFNIKKMLKCHNLK